MDINKQTAARVCNLVVEGVSPQVAALQVLGSVNHPAVDVIEQLQRAEGEDYSRAILKVAAKGLEEIAPDPRADNLGRAFEVMENKLYQVGEEINKERRLTCALGVALRQVLPFAENEVASLHDDAQRDGDEGFAEQAEEGSRSLHRARVLLDKLDKGPLSIRHTKDDAFDEEFQIKFED